MHTAVTDDTMSKYTKHYTAMSWNKLLRSAFKNKCQHVYVWVVSPAGAGVLHAFDTMTTLIDLTTCILFTIPHAYFNFVTRG